MSEAIGYCIIGGWVGLCLAFWKDYILTKGWHSSVKKGARVAVQVTEASVGEDIIEITYRETRTEDV